MNRLLTLAATCLALLALPAHAGDIWEPYDGATGMTCAMYNKGASLRWATKGGDAKPDPVGSVPIKVGKTGEVRLDVTAAIGADGLMLSGAGPIKLHSRESTTGKAPYLLVDGLEVPVTADATISCSTTSASGTSASLSTNGTIALAFGGPIPNGAKVELVVDVIRVYGSGTKTLTARAMTIPRKPEPPVELGLAQKYARDAGIAADPDVLFVIDFDDPDWWRKSSKWEEPKKEACRTVDATTARQGLGFTPLDGGKVLQSVALANTYGSGCSLRYYTKDTIGHELLEGYFRYHVMLGTDYWGSTDGGKTPGMSSEYYQDHTPICGTGGMSCAGGTKGWTLRGGFDMEKDVKNPAYPRVELHTYAYFADQTELYGHNWSWAPQGLLELGKWYAIEQYIKVNDIGQSNGIVRVWVDGKLAMERTNLRLRGEKPWDPRVTGEMGANIFPWIVHFYGGKYPPYVRDHTMWMADFVMAKKYIGPMNTADTLPPPAPVKYCEPGCVQP